MEPIIFEPRGILKISHVGSFSQAVFGSNPLKNYAHHTVSVEHLSPNGKTVRSKIIVKEQITFASFGPYKRIGEKVNIEAYAFLVIDEEHQSIILGQEIRDLLNLLFGQVQAVSRLFPVPFQIVAASELGNQAPDSFVEVSDGNLFLVQLPSKE